jgi:hypothetical protein
VRAAAPWRDRGQLIADSYGGSGLNDGTDTTQFDNVQFTGLIPTPLPASAWLLLSAFGGLALLARAGKPALESKRWRGFHGSWAG